MNRAIGLGLALVAGLSGGSALAMTSQNAPTIHCSVERGEKLPSGLTAEFVCAAIRNAVAPALQRARLSPASLAVRVTVESDRKLVAAATLGGKALPEHRIGISDRTLNARAVDMLATAIAADVGSARQ